MASVDNILLGHVWKDYSSGRSFITYTGSTAATISAVLAIFAAFVGTQTWSIVRLAIWHSFYKRHSKGLFCWRRNHSHPLFEGCSQQQLVLIRNGDGGFDLAKNLIIHWKHWNDWYATKKASYHVCFPLFTIFICGVQFAGWIAAGVVVGQIFASSPNDQALLTGTCGSIGLNNSNNRAQDFAWRALNNNYTVTADQYARQCYAADVAPTSSCSYFTRRMISVQDGDAPCPFLGENACVRNSVPYYVDSQLIDSSTVLGINAPLKDRVFFRKKTTCSPVSSLDRYEIIFYNQTTDNQIWPTGTTLYRFYYGPVNGSSTNDSFNGNWTYEFSDYQPEYNLQYGISSFSYFGATHDNIWKPNASLWDSKREDADIALFFINGNHVVYEYATDDPVFATGASYDEPTDNVTTTIWTPKYYTNVLGCIDQYQLCKSSSLPQTCSPLVGAYRLADEIFRLELSDVQLETAKRLVSLYPTLGTYYTVAGRGAAAFQATLGVTDTLQTLQLPNDHWRTEVKAWFVISLAKLQQLVAQYAALPDDPRISEFFKPPENSIAAAQCHAQRISLPAGATNFDWTGTLVLVSLGLFLWVTGVSAEWLVDKFLLYLKADERRLQWNATGPAGMQRLAYMAAGCEGEWDHEDEGIPVWLPGMSGVPTARVVGHVLLLNKIPSTQNLNQSSSQSLVQQASTITPAAASTTTSLTASLTAPPTAPPPTVSPPPAPPTATTAVGGPINTPLTTQSATVSPIPSTNSQQQGGTNTVGGGSLTGNSGVAQSGP